MSWESWEQAVQDVTKYNDRKSQIQGELADFSIVSDVEELDNLIKRLYSVWNTEGVNREHNIQGMTNEMKNIEMISQETKTAIQQQIQSLQTLQASYSLIEKANENVEGGD